MTQKPRLSGEETAKILSKAQKHLECGQLEKTAELLFDILAANPDNNEVLHLLGDIINIINNMEFSENIFLKLAALHPAHGGILRKLILILTNNKKYTETFDFLNKYLEQNPTDFGALIVLGNNLLNAAQYHDAACIYQKALQFKEGINPKLLAHIYANLALSLSSLGEYQQAIDFFKNSLHLDKTNADTHRNLGIVLLKTTCLEEGFAEYEWRKSAGDKKFFYEKYENKKPCWQGGSFLGKRLLIYHEQGFGDNLNFCRYLPHVKKLGGTVIFAVPAPLISIYGFFLKSGIVDVLVEQNYEYVSKIEYDLAIALMSLPYALKTTCLTEIPAQSPYLFAEKDLVSKWQEKIMKSTHSTKISTDKLKVGLAWAGNPNFYRDDVRSCNFSFLEPLGNIHNIDYYSLQIGGGIEEYPSSPLKMRIHDLTGHIGNFADTAALIENLDLVISVDTAVAHLAGALGKPVWTLLHHNNDWRWFTQSEESPWYPTMRLFRQDIPGQWRTVIDKVVQNLLIFPK